MSKPYFSQTLPTLHDLEDDEFPASGIAQHVPRKRGSINWALIAVIVSAVMLWAGLLIGWAWAIGALAAK